MHPPQCCGDHSVFRAPPHFLPLSGACAARTFATVIPPPPPSVSSRELDVLAEVVRGRTNEEIAARLVISPRTVQTHVRNLMEKTDSRNRTQLAVKAVRLRLTPLPRLDELR